MAKELPYFKFEPNQWENGNIQICTREDKGLFLDLCCMYWSRLGNLPFKLAIQKLCGGNAAAFNSLIKENIFEIINDHVRINFLDEQLNDFDDVSETNRKNALAGWEKRRKQRPESDRNAVASKPQSESDAIREEKRREEKKRNNNVQIDFSLFWDSYNQKVGRKKCLAIWAKMSEDDRRACLESIPHYNTHLKKNSWKAKKNPSTYLNGRHWEDEHLPGREIKSDGESSSGIHDVNQKVKVA